MELLGLDHPLVEAEINRWRDIDPAGIGASINADRGELALLAIWLIEASNSRNERRTLIQPIAVNMTTGTRIPSIERQIQESFRRRESPPLLTPFERAHAFSEFIEPTLERELKMKGVLSENGSFTAELIGLLEVH